jgi:hypothetical protein
MRNHQKTLEEKSSEKVGGEIKSSVWRRNRWYQGEITSLVSLEEDEKEKSG